MPKMKSKGAVKKRFKITKNGKAVCSRSGRGHYRAIRNGDERRASRKEIVLNTVWSELIQRMM